MRKLILLAALVLLVTGCTGPIDNTINDQCLRREIFQQCMVNVPKGPNSTVYNDWAEVVNECEDAAMYQSYRPTSQVAQACRSSQ
jgi:hypothetical protein